MSSDGNSSESLPAPIGILAFDIDGTLADDSHDIPQEMLDFLNQIDPNKWVLSILTGRSLPYAKKAVAVLKRPYIIGAFNGSVIRTYPEKKLLYKKMIPPQLVDYIRMVTDSVPHLHSSFFSNSGAIYVTSRHEEEHHSDHFHAADRVDITSKDRIEHSCVMISIVGLKEDMQHAQDLLSQAKGITMTGVRSALIQGKWYCLLITQEEASKGHALEFLAKTYGNAQCPLFRIAAGDDMNDVPMFKVANTSIVMGHARGEVKDYANMIAPHPYTQGLIQAAQEAMSEAERKAAGN